MGSGLRVLGIAGSLRKASYNRALLRAALELAPEGLQLEIYEGLGDIPVYNGDVEAQGFPEPVVRLKEAIRAADALLIATPEYNGGVPGMLKNAIDWASRPPKETPLRGKPVALMGASPGMLGTARAQTALRQSFIFLQMPAMPAPEVLVARAHEKIDSEGRLSDETTRQHLRQFLEAVRDWTRRFKTP
jgi:chromate reductase, NAD(P)H dehydrogenase (quinone)